MANQVNKKIKVTVEVDGQKRLVDLQTAIKLTEAELLRQTAIADKYNGVVKKNAEERAKQQKEYLIGLTAQLRMQQQLDRYEAELERKRKAREQAEELRVKRSAIAQRRQTEDFWAKPSFRGAWNMWASPTTKLRREIQHQRDIEDEMTVLSVKGETPEVRADAAAKAASAATAGKAASGKLAGVTAVTAVLKGIQRVVKTIGNVFSQVLGQSISIRGIFSDILKDASDTANLYKGMGTYSANSLVVNSAARQTMLKYGMTGQQAWAFQQASDMFGISSDEDLLYMTNTQRQVFAQYMQKQQAWYDKLEQSGALRNIQEMQLDLKLFKQEMSMEFLQWVSENKDTIMTVAKTTLQVLKGLVQILGKIFTFFGIDYSDSSYGWSSTAMSDASNSVTNTTNRNVSVKMTNNVNGMFNQNEMEQFLNDRLETAVRSAATALN